MLECLLPYLGVILDVGNIIFFVANFPQIITAYKNRKNLQGLSSKMLFGYMIATIFFFMAGLITGGIMTAILCAINEVIFGTQLYWKWRHK